MSDDGELSPSTSPTSTSSSPSSSPTFEQKRAASAPPAPRERAPAAPNPRATRPDHWSDKHTAEGRALAASRARRGETSEPPSTAAAAAPAGAPGEPRPAAGDGEQPKVGPIERTEDGRYKFGELALSEQEIKDLLQHQSAEESRRASLPADPSGYELKLPGDFVIPPGVEFSFNENDVRARLAREFALEAGLSQAQFERLIAIDAARQVDELATFNRIIGAEVKKLGATGTARVTAIQNFLRGTLGDAGAEPFIQMLLSERMVKGWEKIIQQITGQGAGTFSQAHREPPESSNGKIPGYETMTFEQRRAAQSAARRGDNRR